MNVEDVNKTSLSERLRLEKEQQLQLLRVPFSAEETSERNDCVFSLCCKIALPFAILSQLASSFRAKEMERAPKPLYMRGFSFFGNIFLGLLLFKPFCDYTVLAKRAELDRKQRESAEGIISHSTDDMRIDDQPSSRPDDFSYPIDLLTDLNEPEGTYTTDFTSTKLDTEEEKEVKAKTTTYQDLRAKHRSSHSNKYTPPASTLSFDSETTPRRAPTPVEEPVPTESQVRKPRKLNKYGDEME